MKTKLLYPAAGVLALAVSPLFAQQDDAPSLPDAPAPPSETPQIDEEAEQAEATVEAVDETVDGEAADADVVEIERVEVQPARPAQRGAVVQQRIVVRGNAANAQLVVGGRGGLEPRAFNAELAGLDELALGAVTDGVTTDNDPSSYRFDAEGPGLLTVAVRAKEGDDMTIEVYNASGQQLARCDIDFGGNTGAEHLAVPIPEAGSYRVVVEPLGNGGPFWMGASWLAFQELEAMAPASPDDAVELTPGQAQDAALDANETWFTYTAPGNGLLMFSTAGDQGDLVIEAFYEGRLDQQIQYSDQDRNNSAANERILMDLVEGQTVFLKVRGFGSGEGTEFTATSRFIEDE